jgi:hydrogenase-1 operon protein HyaF
MNSFPIPVRMVGAGSHVEEEELQYLDMPRDMNTFSMPYVPEDRDGEALTGARDLLAELLARMETWAPGNGANPRLDLRDTTPETIAVTNEMLGDGEVSIQVNGPRRLRIQESVFAGIWRVVEFDRNDRIVADWIEVGALPQAVIEAAHAGSSATVPEVGFPDGAMNSPAVLHELRGQIATRAPSTPAHVLNLTLFPMTPEDHSVLERAFPVGPVAIISRGFGNCRITSTTARDVWRVQYFNSMNTLILNTIEVVGVPEVALAANEDLSDSRVRLAELISWISESCPA